MKKINFRISLSLIAISIVISGCTSSKDIPISKMNINNNLESLCNSNFYSGKIKTGVLANIEKGSPTIIEFNIGNKVCSSVANSKALYQTNKILLDFNSMKCEGQKEIRVKGQILGQECSSGIKANHKINLKAIKFIEEKMKITPSLIYKKELIKAQIGYLETEPNRDVFVQIIEPSYFMHKDKIHMFGY